MAEESTWLERLGDKAASTAGLLVDLELARHYTTDDSGPTVTKQPGESAKLDGAVNSQQVTAGNGLLIAGGALVALLAIALIARG